MGLDDNTTDLGTAQIKDWRSIVTLIVFVLTNITVLFPFHIPIYVSRRLKNALLRLLASGRVLPPRTARTDTFQFPMNFVTAPLIADLFLLAILAIGREEVYGGTIDASNIQPYDIMLFFFSLAYIAISIDASGLIRYLAFKVLQRGGGEGHRLFFYLYTFFFGLGSFIGNDPIILSGTAFLAYMTRVSRNIVHPRAWIHSQFAVANIASAILVSSNPTNLVLAGAFQVKFLDYTANMIVPVIITAIVLYPCLFWIIFNDEEFVPSRINIHELSDEAKSRKPVNPNIPNAKRKAAEEGNQDLEEQGREEIMNPFLDRRGAAFGALIMAATLIAIIVLNASSTAHGAYPVFYVTLPAAIVMLCWDIAFGWSNRHETRRIAQASRDEAEQIRREREAMMVEAALLERSSSPLTARDSCPPKAKPCGEIKPAASNSPGPSFTTTDEGNAGGEKQMLSTEESDRTQGLFLNDAPSEDLTQEKPGAAEYQSTDIAQNGEATPRADYSQPPNLPTLSSWMSSTHQWSQETFPTVTAVLSHLPYALIPFSFCMFILVQALVTKGWVQVFAYGWDHWVDKTGTVGAVGGMGFLSVILCNFAGTNIGTTILLSRVIQHWTDIHKQPGSQPITERTFWATVYGMALGVNYGAFSAAFSASLAGLLWRDILGRKHIHVKRLDFARVNLPIIAIAMTVGCAVLIGEVYIMRHNTPLGN